MNVASGKIFRGIIWIICFISGLAMSGCYVPKKYQAGKPFVFKNNIELGGNISGQEKKDLLLGLKGQLDDSLQVKIKDILFIRHVINGPAMYDTSYSISSLPFLIYYMNGQGYFSAQAAYKYKYDTISSKQIRATTTFFVTPGPRTLLDSIRIELSDSNMQHLANATRGETLLAKGQPFTTDKVVAEADRLVNLFKNHGYYKLTRDEFYALMDTADPVLINPNIDPLERIRIISERTQKNPTADLVFHLKPGSDSTDKIKPYSIRKVLIYPDYESTRSNRTTPLTGTVIDSVIIRYKTLKFKPTFLIRNNFLHPGELYKQDNYVKTVNTYNILGPWSVVNIQARDTIMKGDSIGKLDFFYLLTPAKKQSFNTDFELSYSNGNNNISSIAGGNIVGAAINFGITNRNLGKEAISMTNTIRAGAEVNPYYDWQLASVDLGYTNTVNFPRFVTPFGGLNKKRFLYQKTVINTSVGYTERINYFNINSFNFNFGYEWQKKKNLFWTYRPLNIEYSYLFNQSDAFNTALDQNPYLKYAYTTALVIGQQLGLIYNFHHRKDNHTSSIRTNLEESGLLAGRIKRATDGDVFGQLYEFVKMDVEYKYEIKYPNNSSWNFRLYAGVGIPLGNDTARNKTLPFFKQFIAGGPNSMRAWPFRSLGPGSTARLPYGSSYFNDRFGDMQLEANIEYRYNIAEIIPNSMYLKGAFFTDIGNVWNVKRDATKAPYDSAHFDLSRIYQQIAVGGGAGLRIDFNYFVVRFDMGLRFKRPDNPLNDGWHIPDVNLARIFGNSDENKRWRYDNFNFSFGIGYSF